MPSLCANFKKHRLALLSKTHARDIYPIAKIVFSRKRSELPALKNSCLLKSGSPNGNQWFHKQEHKKGH